MSKKPKGPPRYRDLADLPENQRIDEIARLVKLGQKVAFFVDDEPKADRYLKKLTNRMGDTKYFIHYRGPYGPVAGVVLITVSIHPEDN